MKTLMLCLALAQAAPDAPRIVQLENGDYLLPRAAFLVLDAEVKRLQAIEQQHRSERWLTTVLVSAGVGLVVGALAAGIAVYAAVPKAPASPSP